MAAAECSCACAAAPHLSDSRWAIYRRTFRQICRLALEPLGQKPAQPGEGYATTLTTKTKF
jgi:hypothetical protein